MQSSVKGTVKKRAWKNIPQIMQTSSNVGGQNALLGLDGLTDLYF